MAKLHAPSVASQSCHVELGYGLAVLALLFWPCCVLELGHESITTSAQDIPLCRGWSRHRGLDAQSAA